MIPWYAGIRGDYIDYHKFLDILVSHSRQRIAREYRGRIGA